MQPIIDAHLHFWDLSQFVLPEVESYEPLKKNFLLSDAAQAIGTLPVEKVVYMEVNLIQEQKYSEAENVTKICKQDDNPIDAAFIGGDPLSYSFRDYAPLFRDNEYIKGVRHVLHPPERQKGYCLETQFIDNIRLLGELGLKFAICMRPSELNDAVKLAEFCPDTTLILDHCGNGVPAIINGSVKENEYEMDIFRHDPDQWMRDIENLAARENVICKISGMLFKTDPDCVTPQFLAPTINHCLDAFGPDRVMFGSNWPVCTLTTSYKNWIDVLNEVIQGRGDEFKNKLYYDNANRIYEL